MTAGKLIAYIAAAILIFFGVLFIWGAFSSNPQPAWILAGGINVAIGFGLIWLASHTKTPGGSQEQEVTYKLDLSGKVNLESLKCKSCGGTLSADNIKLVTGAPWVTCPYCSATYQLTEEPKW